MVNLSTRGSDQDGAFLLFAGHKIYRLHLVGSVAALEINEESGSGYFILDDTFSTVLVHFQSDMFGIMRDVNKGELVEVLGSLDMYNDSVTLALGNIKKVDAGR